MLPHFRFKNSNFSGLCEIEPVADNVFEDIRKPHASLAPATPTITLPAHTQSSSSEYNAKNSHLANKEHDDIIDIGCYSFKDLCTWINDGIVLTAEETDETHDLHKSNVLERPKVIYNENTGKYIMWMHIDDTNCIRAATGTAISSSYTGPFDYIKSFRPHGFESKDMTIFKNNDGKQPWWYRVESDCERSEVATSA
ncbi:glycosyl hydrolase family protein 43 [Tanacetum coccineum]